MVIGVWSDQSGSATVLLPLIYYDCIEYIDWKSQGYSSLHNHIELWQ